jgi:hypothetical protein
VPLHALTLFVTLCCAGTAGALITIPLIVVACVHWTWKWGMRAFEITPPEGYPWERQQLLGNLWMQVRKRTSFAPFYTKNDHLTKTGSGHT